MPTWSTVIKYRCHTDKTTSESLLTISSLGFSPVLFGVLFGALKLTCLQFCSLDSNGLYDLDSGSIGCICPLLRKKDTFTRGMFDTKSICT